MNCCSCLKNMLNKITKNKKQRRAYQGNIEYEQVQFLNPNKSDQSYLNDKISKKDPLTKQKQPQQLIQNQYFIQTQQKNDDQIDLLNYKMSFEQQKKSIKQNKKEQKDIQDLLRQQLQGSTLIKLQQTSSNNSNPVYQQFSEHVMYETFNINIDPLDPYYNILAEKTKKITNIFDKQGQKIQIGFPNKTNLQIQLLDNNKVSTYIIKYKLNCSYSFYISATRSDKILQKFSKLIAETKIIQSFKANLTKNTLKFHKIGSFEARDCFYVKYHNGGNRQHWEVYINAQKSQFGSNYKTCEVFCIKNIRQKSQNQLIINQYLQIDLQTTNLSNILPKITNQFKNYLNTFQDHIQQNYEQESA